jgi:hypothetical protein
MWRISLAPVANKYGLVPWLGFSLGKRFWEKKSLN